MAMGGNIGYQDAPEQDACFRFGVATSGVARKHIAPHNGAHKLANQEIDANLRALFARARTLATKWAGFTGGTGSPRTPQRTRKKERSIMRETVFTFSPLLKMLVLN